MIWMKSVSSTTMRRGSRLLGTHLGLVVLCSVWTSTPSWHQLNSLQLWKLFQRFSESIQHNILTFSQWNHFQSCKRVFFWWRISSKCNWYQCCKRYGFYICLLILNCYATLCRFYFNVEKLFPVENVMSKKVFLKHLYKN